MSEQTRRDLLQSAARWALAAGSIAGVTALIARRGEACRLPLACAECALATRCRLPERTMTNDGRRMTGDGQEAGAGGRRRGQGPIQNPKSKIQNPESTVTQRPPEPSR